VEIVASLSQGRTAAAQCGLFTYKSVPVIFEPPCNFLWIYNLLHSQFNVWCTTWEFNSSCQIIDATCVAFDMKRSGLSVIAILLLPRLYSHLPLSNRRSKPQNTNAIISHCTVWSITAGKWKRVKALQTTELENTSSLRLKR